MARILIVDDAAFMRMMLKDILTKGGFEIAGEAADGNEAIVIDAIQSGAKDFIVKPFQADRVIESIRKVLG